MSTSHGCTINFEKLHDEILQKKLEPHTTKLAKIHAIIDKYYDGTLTTSDRVFAHEVIDRGGIACEPRFNAEVNVEKIRLIARVMYGLAQKSEVQLHLIGDVLHIPGARSGIVPHILDDVMGEYRSGAKAEYWMTCPTSTHNVTGSNFNCVMGDNPKTMMTNNVTGAI